MRRTQRSGSRAERLPLLQRLRDAASNERGDIFSAIPIWMTVGMLVVALLYILVVYIMMSHTAQSVQSATVHLAQDVATTLVGGPTADGQQYLTLATPDGQALLQAVGAEGESEYPGLSWDESQDAWVPSASDSKGLVEGIALEGVTPLPAQVAGGEPGVAVSVEVALRVPIPGVAKDPTARYPLSVTAYARPSGASTN